MPYFVSIGADGVAGFRLPGAADDIAVVLRRGGTLRTLHYIPVGE